MANPATNPTADIDLTGPLNNLTDFVFSVFELPDKRVGDDRGATCLRQNPLHRPGTPARNQFDQNNQMTIEVRFKIYTPTAVDINISNPSPEKVGAGKKAGKSIKLNLLNSKKMKGQYLDIKTCLFGKSLNKFKEIVAAACEEFQGGMKSIILNRDFSPELMWKTSVGRSKHVLESVEQWQAFVTALEKSIKRQGLVVIENENKEVQSLKEKKDSATIKLIEQTNGGGSESQDSKESNQDAELHIMANKIFSQAGISGYAGGEGTVLSVPWNPAFRYWLTYVAAWIWAKAVMAEIKKSEWTHPDMGVDDRVYMRLQGHPRKLRPVKDCSSSSRKAKPFTNTDINIEAKPDPKKLNRKSLINSSEPVELKPDLKMLTNKRIIIDLTDPMESKPDLKKVFNDPDMIESKGEVKKIKIENQPGNSIDDPIAVSSDTESNHSDTRTGDSDIDGIDIEYSKGNPIKVDDSDDSSCDSELEIPTLIHTITMELFLTDCNIPSEDSKTRTLLKDAGIISWTDLIPSVQMTESTLTSKGLNRQLASRLMDAAKARYYTQVSNRIHG
ncbi:hypothetical protein DFH28DRAFT_1198081 [Melampsora americana]|nr:hypothetical protein DFH28DRAFT_1198081 [Melampsora americana]